MKRRKGFTLVELMVVVAIVAILAAVALPMYSQFKQKAALRNVQKALQGIQTALQIHYEQVGDFTDPALTFDAASGTFQYTNNQGVQTSVGSPLSDIPGVTWTVSYTQNVVHVDFTWGIGFCPPSSCDGFWELVCDPVPGRGGKPYVNFDVLGDELGIDANPGWDVDPGY